MATPGSYHLLIFFRCSSTVALPINAAQIIKNLPAVQETQVQSLDWEDPLVEGVATHSIILAWRIPMGRGARAGYSSKVAKSWT